MATETISTERAPGRSGRPPRALAGEVERRILNAAAHVFLDRGFEGASVDEIASVARAGKPTIYARFPGKEALFAAVITRKVRDNAEFMKSFVVAGSTREERVASIATALLQKVLVAETIGLMRWAISEARRFPDLASSVSKMAREQQTEAIAQLFGDVARTDEAGSLPAFAPDRLKTTSRYFIDLTLLPLVLRALLGENLDALHEEIAPHVSRTVAFFLAGCRQGG